MMALKKKLTAPNRRLTTEICVIPSAETAGEFCRLCYARVDCPPAE